MEKILIVTSSYDKTCDYIIQKYNDVDFFRLDLDFFSKYSISYTKDGFVISNGNDILHEASCSSIYYRKPTPENLNGIIDLKYQSFSHKEAYSLIEGIVEAFDGTCLTKPSIMRPAGNKIFQAKIAQQVGFEAPDYLMTNNADFVKEYQANEAIVKPLSVGVIQDEKTKEYVQTNMIDANINLDALKYSPSYFQLYQKKDYEIRATFVDSEVFVVKIESLNEIDWRKSDNKITYSVFEMPKDIYSKCVKFMKLCKMDFGCFDFIVHNDSWYFLEMNVNGQWAWLEFETELNISGSIVRYLRGN
ncbi:hypothetical protein KO527_11685 [Pseudoalteromonas sp. C2R02]|uniref:MvdC/MvdD family ATP grasp protein n=1 Tax=Pseudoalteromonas sp. C2R02 TaxID=2841565 RepID=UPI001C09139D|nr:hypothetical protein [Pseudoalteromonas sp. C2R02]MBU2970012.1 hypothetical protein [Pseudoalteromonas sp. C2R02]